MPTLDKQRDRLNRWRVLGALVALIGSGCEPGRTLGRVTGTVTLDGQVCRDVVVVFMCREQRAFITAVVDAEGGYEVQMAEGHGLPVGTYQVSIRPAPPANWDRPQSPTRVPQRYGDPATSGLSLEVEPGDNVFAIAMKSQ